VSQGGACYAWGKVSGDDFANDDFFSIIDEYTGVFGIFRPATLAYHRIICQNELCPITGNMILSEGKRTGCRL
jgi:hypothetical protein